MIKKGIETQFVQFATKVWIFKSIKVLKPTNPNAKPVKAFG